MSQSTTGPPPVAPSAAPAPPRTHRAPALAALLVTVACVLLDAPTHGLAAWAFVLAGALAMALVLRAPAPETAPLAGGAGPLPAPALLREGLVLGLTGFGGGLAVLSQIEHRLVEQRRWIDTETFLESAALAQSLPGAIAFNALAFIGWRLGATAGAIALVSGFILPSFLILLTFALLYPTLRQLEIVAGVFHLLTPAVAGLIAAVAVRLGERVVLTRSGEPAGWRGLARDRWSFAVMLAAALSVALFGFGVLETLLVAGLLGMARYLRVGGHSLLDAVEIRWRWLRWRMWVNVQRELASRGPRWLRRHADEDDVLAVAPVWLLAGPSLALALERLQLFGSLAGIFLRAGTLTFGGGFVMIPLLEAELVLARHWLTPQAFTDAMTLGQVTPGPVVITATFVGYTIAGLAGALLSTVAVFLPAFVMALVVSSSLERFRSNLGLQAFLDGLQPAIVGLMFAAAVIMVRHGVHDPVAGAAALLSFVLLWRWKLNPAWVVLGAGVLGIVESVIHAVA